MHDEALTVLPEILKRDETRKIVLIGHSDGASIALIHAGGRSDARILGLVLVAPHVVVEYLNLASIRETKVAYETKNLRERLARYHGDNVDCAFFGWNRAWLDPGFLDWNLENFLPQIEIPVLLIQGEEDPYGTIRQLDTIQSQLSGSSEILLLPDCGHSPFRDRPTETLHAIAAFVEQHLS